MIDPALRDRVLRALWPSQGAHGSSVFAILDCARDDRIYPSLRSPGLDYRCLYSGRLPSVLERAAPHLVELTPTSSFTRRLIETGWGQSWGIFLRTRDWSKVRHHLRTFLRVQDESGGTLLFRYYDPRVLRIYLPTCTPVELKTVFGPIDSYLAESEDGQSLEEFTFDGTQLRERRTSVVSG